MGHLTLQDITTDDPNRQYENVALYRQVCSGNPPDLNILRNSGSAFPDRSKGGFDYCDFLKDGWINNSRKVNLSNFTKFPWLYLKPDILEHLLIQIWKQDKDCIERLEKYSEHVAAWFIFDDAEPLELKGIGKINYYEFSRFYSRIFSSFTNNTQNYDKDQLQRKEVTLSRGEGLTGAVIHGRQHKATVTVGHLSYQVCPE